MLASVRRAVPIALGALLAALLAAGCGAARPGSGRPAAGGTATAPSGGMAGMPGMSGTNMGASSTASAAGMSAGGITPIPTQLLGSADWQGMKITAKAMTVVPFVIYNGTSEQTVKPSPKDSFHLMVLLNDAQTNVVIPYASVWATITEGTRTVFDERQWPMISRYMGPHYGNDVALPGAGTYRLTLLVSPPVSARHVEYENVWLKPHRVTFTFHWKPAS